jgi:hypothetical protein
VDGVQGSALTSLDGEVWRVLRTSDDGELDQPVPDP